MAFQILRTKRWKKWQKWKMLKQKQQKEQHWDLYRCKESEDPGTESPNHLEEPPFHLPPTQMKIDGKNSASSRNTTHTPVKPHKPHKQHATEGDFNGLHQVSLSSSSAMRRMACREPEGWPDKGNQNHSDGKEWRKIHGIADSFWISRHLSILHTTKYDGMLTRMSNPNAFAWKVA